MIRDVGHRCMSSALIGTETLRYAPKRCTRYLDHDEPEHLWVEDWNVVGRQPMVAFWHDGDERATIFLARELPVEHRRIPE